jgi:branched-subunit amino acid aminotransferase/4-amino-4-deoxychorismate lyase
LRGIGLQRLAQLKNFSCLERPIHSSEIAHWNMAIAVNAVRGVMLVESIDGKPYSAHAILAELSEEFFRHDEIHQS